MVDPITCPVVLVRRWRGCGEAGRMVHVVALSDIFGAVHTTLHAAADAEGGCGK